MSKKTLITDSPYQKALKKICQQVEYFNVMYGADPKYRLYLTTEYERRVEGAKMIAFGEQYANDIASITLHETFGFADERQKRFCDDFVKNYNYFREAERLDREVDEDTEYSRHEFEEILKAAVGVHYMPYDERYTFTITAE